MKMPQKTLPDSKLWDNTDQTNKQKNRLCRNELLSAHFLHSLFFRNSIAEQTQFFGQNRIFSNLSWKVTHILTFIYPFAAVRKMV